MPVCQSYCELLNDIVTQMAALDTPLVYCIRQVMWPIHAHTAKRACTSVMYLFGGYACPFMVHTQRVFTGMASYAELAM